MEAIKFDPALEAVKRAFCMGLTMGAITVEIDGQTRPWRWVLDELEFCEDEMPDDTCDFLGIEPGMSYAQAIKYWWDANAFNAHFFPKLLEDPSLSPEMRAAMQLRLDLVYLMTGWERPTPGNG